MGSKFVGSSGLVAGGAGCKFGLYKFDHNLGLRSGGRCRGWWEGWGGEKGVTGGQGMG